MFEGIRAAKGSYLIRKTSGHRSRCHHKGLQQRPMLENDKTGTEEENCSLHCVQDGQNRGGISLRHSWIPLLSAAMVQNGLLNGLKNCGNRFLIFSDNNSFMSDPVFNKQNDRVVTFGNDVSENLIVNN